MMARPAVATSAAPEIAVRDRVGAADLAAVRAMVRATGFFSAQEEGIAVELVEERLAKGAASGYEFRFAERAGRLLGYTCYGLIPLTEASFDLYWIVVDPAAQGTGVGRLLLAETPRAVAPAAGTAHYAATSSRAQEAPPPGFYLSAGYRTAAEFPDFYAPGDGKVVFVKRMAAD